MSRTALIKLRSVLGQALAWAERRHLSSGNPARIVDLPAAARRPTIGRALTVEEAKRLLTAAADDRLNALWVLMLMLGLRPGEALGLCWMDVDFDRGVIHVRRSLKLEGGKPVIDERLKTSRARRSLDAPAALVDALRDHRKRQVAERLHAGAMWAAAIPEPVFTTEVGTLLNASNVRRSFLEVIERAELGHLRIYDLRHSAASILSAAGVPIEHIADVLGHDGIRMTALVYRHALSPTVSAAQSPMNALFG